MFTKSRQRPDLLPSSNSFGGGHYYGTAVTYVPSSSRQLRERFKQQLLDSFSQFSRETSLHGLKRITSSIPVWQKIVWIFMIIGMCVTLVFQLKNKFDSYWESPVSLYMNVRYETAVPFPSVILCNANLFRISETTTDKWHSLYDVINSVYQHPALDVTSTAFYHNLKKIDGSLFIKTAAHQKENLILGCQWPNGQKCGPENFRTVVTDYGVCYAINDGFNRSEVLNVTNSGFGYALYLVLNAEDYEAMAGPQKTVGIKVLIYKQGDIPLISEQGFDVAPGFQTSVGLKYREINKLEKSKGGECGTGKLYLFEKEAYSSKICTVDRKYHAAVNACNCLPYLVPDGVLNKSVCDASQFFGCMINATQTAILNISKDDCPEDCQSVEYQQYVSFSELSTSHINSILTSKQRENIKKQYLSAREARSRNTESEVANDALLVENLLFAYNESENNSLIPGSAWESTVDNKIYNSTCYRDYFVPLIELDHFCNVDAIEVMLTKNLERLLLPQMKDNLQRLIREVNNTAKQFSASIEEIDGALSRQNQNPSSAEFDEVRTAVARHFLVESCKVSLKTANRTLEHATKDVRHDLDLLDAHWSDVQNITALKKFNDTNKLIPNLRKVEECLSDVVDAFPTSDEVTYENLAEIRALLQSTFELTFDCVRGLESFRKTFVAYQDLATSYRSNHTVTLEHIRTACKKFNRIRQISAVTPSPKPSRIDDYYEVKDILLTFLNHTRTKANTSDAILEIGQRFYFPQVVKNYFDDVKRYVVSLQNDLFKEAVASFASLVTYFDNVGYSDILQTLYPEIKNKTNITQLLIKANSCSPRINAVLEDIGLKSDETAELYFKSFSEIKEELQNYNNSLKLDLQFFRSNLLALNIYLREMSTEVLAQRLSYDSWSLLSNARFFINKSIRSLRSTKRRRCNASLTPMTAEAVVGKSEVVDEPSSGLLKTYRSMEEQQPLRKNDYLSIDRSVANARSETDVAAADGLNPSRHYAVASALERRRSFSDRGAAKREFYL